MSKLLASKHTYKVVQMFNSKNLCGFNAVRRYSLRPGFTPTPKNLGVGSPSERGFTLMEILIVIAISLLLLSVTLSVFLSFSKSRAIDVASGRIIDTLRIARSNTLASKDESVYGVHFASSTITLFKGGSFSSVDSNNVV